MWYAVTIDGDRGAWEQASSCPAMSGCQRVCESRVGLCDRWGTMANVVSSVKQGIKLLISFDSLEVFVKWEGEQYC